MTTMDAAATAEAKLAFWRLSASHSVTIRHYHADNGLFDTKAFKAAMSKAERCLSAEEMIITKMEKQRTGSRT
jgi:hypothetical protein